MWARTAFLFLLLNIPGQSSRSPRVLTSGARDLPLHRTDARRPLLLSFRAERGICCPHESRSSCRGGCPRPPKRDLARRPLCCASSRSPRVFTSGPRDLPLHRTAARSLCHSERSEESAVLANHQARAPSDNVREFLWQVTEQLHPGNIPCGCAHSGAHSRERGLPREGSDTPIREPGHWA